METSQLHWIDTHCHLYVEEFDADRHKMMERALEAGVMQLMLPNIDLSSVASMHRLVEQFPRHCFPMMGLHPCSVKADYQAVLMDMKNLLDQGDYAGIGETGVDLYWDTTFRSEQIEAFEQQIGWAKEKQLPVIIHSRESLDLNIGIIRKHQDGRLKGIFHCFGGTYEQAKEIADIGFHIGIGGVITYKKSDLSDVVRRVPTNLLVLETDSPYLAPVPFRGKRNEPAYIPVIASRLATALSMSLDEVARLTSQNAREVFEKKS
jgi:TatD DNase family protein